MLVRILSFAASVLGTRRYRPVLFSCLAVILLASGTFMVTSAMNGNSYDAASQIQRDKDLVGTSAKDASPQVGGTQKQTIKDGQNVGGNTDTGNTGGTTATDKQPTTPSTPASTLDITLSASAITLSQNTVNVPVQVSTTDKSSAVWSVTQSTAENSPRIEIEAGKESGSSSIVRLRGDDTPNGTYTYSVSAKDAKGVVVTKAITLTINL